MVSENMGYVDKSHWRSPRSCPNLLWNIWSCNCRKIWYPIAV